MKSTLESLLQEKNNLQDIDSHLESALIGEIQRITDTPEGCAKSEIEYYITEHEKIKISAWDHSTNDYGVSFEYYRLNPETKYLEESRQATVEEITEALTWYLQKRVRELSETVNRRNRLIRVLRSR